MRSVGERKSERAREVFAVVNVVVVVKVVNVVVVVKVVEVVEVVAVFAFDLIFFLVRKKKETSFVV